jgi:hypothetical protein
VEDVPYELLLGHELWLVKGNGIVDVDVGVCDRVFIKLALPVLRDR